MNIARVMRRSLFPALAALLAAPALAQYPDHAIKAIVPFPPGGGTDVFARLASELSALHSRRSKKHCVRARR